MQKHYSEQDLAKLFIERARGPVEIGNARNFVQYDVKLPYTQNTKTDRELLEQITALFQPIGLAPTEFIDPSEHEQGTKIASKPGEFTISFPNFRADVQYALDMLTQSEGSAKVDLGDYFETNGTDTFLMGVQFTFHKDDFPRAKAHLESLLSMQGPKAPSHP